ncbi:MAG: thiamine ABC transporter substrate-binding protein [Propionibacteriaceae bacterium]|jgi:thiamine transport system substrate-binding protein|nr:thiamine ABC transporter substrate-binding protein [Propionibacteriaceae bacterium]
MSHRLAAFALAAVLLAGCAGQPASTQTPASETAGPTESKTLTVISHESFVISDEDKAKFEEQTGYSVTYSALGDAGTVVSQLVLTKDNPLGDVVFGVDNTFAGKALEEGVFSTYNTQALSADVLGKYALQGAEAGQLTPIDYGEVCLNADDTWFADKKLAIPQTLDDLLKPEYKGLLVVSSPATSSPGLAFLFTTRAAKGDAYLDYWKALKDNGLKVVSGWEDAYNVEFSAVGGGNYPLVLSYNTSPASTVKDGKATTSTLTQTCFQQTEYAGVLKGAQNEVGAQKFIDFLLSEGYQSTIPDSMWMFPVNPSAKVPEDWEKYAAKIDKPWTLPVDQTAEFREQWIKEWTETVVG